MLKQLTSREDWNEKSVGAKGFTLIELLVVIIILGILAGVAIFAVGNIGTTSKKSACNSEKSTVLNATEAWNAQNQAYPSGGAAGITQLTGVGGNLKSTPKYWTLNGTGDDVARILTTGPGSVPTTDCS